jgi:CRISPR-associated protein Cas2
MDIVVTYDVDTTTPAGRKRLRQTAKACLAYGQRVQFSVFECTLNETNLIKLKSRLINIMDADLDSLRIYYLRGGRESSTEVYGRDTWMDFEEPLMI